MGEANNINNNKPVDQAQADKKREPLQRPVARVPAEIRPVIESIPSLYDFVLSWTNPKEPKSKEDVVDEQIAKGEFFFSIKGEQILHIKILNHFSLAAFYLEKAQMSLKANKSESVEVYRDYVRKAIAHFDSVPICSLYCEAQLWKTKGYLMLGENRKARESAVALINTVMNHRNHGPLRSYGDSIYGFSGRAYVLIGTSYLSEGDNFNNLVFAVENYRLALDNLRKKDDINLKVEAQLGLAEASFSLHAMGTVRLDGDFDSEVLGRLLEVLKVDVEKGVLAGRTVLRIETLDDLFAALDKEFPIEPSKEKVLSVFVNESRIRTIFKDPKDESWKQFFVDADAATLVFKKNAEELINGSGIEKEKKEALIELLKALGDNYRLNLTRYISFKKGIAEDNLIKALLDIADVLIYKGSGANNQALIGKAEKIYEFILDHTFIDDKQYLYMRAVSGKIEAELFRAKKALKEGRKEEAMERLKTLKGCFALAAELSRISLFGNRWIEEKLRAQQAGMLDLFPGETKAEIPAGNSRNIYRGGTGTTMTAPENIGIVRGKDLSRAIVEAADLDEKQRKDDPLKTPSFRARLKVLKKAVEAADQPHEVASSLRLLKLSNPGIFNLFITSNPEHLDERAARLILIDRFNQISALKKEVKESPASPLLRTDQLISYFRGDIPSSGYITKFSFFNVISAPIIQVALQKLVEAGYLVRFERSPGDTTPPHTASYLVTDKLPEKPEDIKGLPEDIFDENRKEVIHNVLTVSRRALSLETRTANTCRRISSDFVFLNYIDSVRSELLEKMEFKAAYEQLKKVLNGISGENALLISCGSRTLLDANFAEVVDENGKSVKGGSNPWLAPNLASLFAQACLALADASREAKKPEEERVYLEEARTALKDALYLTFLFYGPKNDGLNCAALHSLSADERLSKEKALIEAHLDYIEKKVKLSEAAEWDLGYALDLPQIIGSLESELMAVELKLGTAAAKAAGPLLAKGIELPEIYEKHFGGRKLCPAQALISFAQLAQEGKLEAYKDGAGIILALKLYELVLTGHATEGGDLASLGISSEGITVMKNDYDVRLAKLGKASALAAKPSATDAELTEAKGLYEELLKDFKPGQFDSEASLNGYVNLLSRGKAVFGKDPEAERALAIKLFERLLAGKDATALVLTDAEKAMLKGVDPKIFDYPLTKAYLITEARLGLGNVLLAKEGPSADDLKTALDQFKAVLSSPSASAHQKEMAMLGMGSVLEKQGKTELAQKVYKFILGDYTGYDMDKLKKNEQDITALKNEGIDPGLFVKGKDKNVILEALDALSKTEIAEIDQAMMKRMLSGTIKLMVNTADKRTLKILKRLYNGHRDLFINSRLIKDKESNNAIHEALIKLMSTESATEIETLFISIMRLSKD